MTNTKAPKSTPHPAGASASAEPAQSQDSAKRREISPEIQRVNYLWSLPLKTRTDYPKARNDEALAAIDMADEHVVYDQYRHQVHSLNPTAAQVWRWCDGETSASTLSKRLGKQHGLPQKQAQALLHLTLNRLEKAKLLEARVKRPDDAVSVTRRQLMGLLPAALLPVVVSIVSPSAAAAASGCTCITVSGGFGFCPAAGACGTGLGTCFANSDCTLPVETGIDCPTCDGLSRGSWLKA